MSAVLERPAKAVRQAQPTIEQILGPQWNDIEWRLRSLYWIVTDEGKSVRFEPNEEQLDFVRNLWSRNLILKSRQLGFSTLMQILELDQALMNKDFTAAVISDTLPNAGKLFGKVEHAYAKLPPALRAALPLKSHESKSTLEFAHGSTIYISTAPRGGTVQLLHVSELGKIARKFPERANEIVTGGFEAVPITGCIVVESTAEGAAGAFYDLCATALKRQAAGEPESPLDWRLHFYAWFQKRSNRLDPALVTVLPADHAYFDGLVAKLRENPKYGPDFTIEPEQRAWYVKKRETLGRSMKREHPSTPEEAFEQAIEGAIFGQEMTRVREAGRITVVPINPEFVVDTFWDFGTGDTMAVWLHQEIALQHRWVKFFPGFGSGLTAFWRMLEAWRMKNGEFKWGRHHLPHDAAAEVLGQETKTKEQMLIEAGMRDIKVVSRIPFKTDAIELARQKLPVDNWFDKIECADGIKALDGYQYVWNDKMGRWSNDPLHNWASHPADAWMQYAQGYTPMGKRIDARTLKNFKNRSRRPV